MNWDKIKLYGLTTLIVVLVGIVIYGAIAKASSDAEMARLRNEVASKDVTIEVQNGVYSKLAIESENIKKMLDARDKQVSDLMVQISKNKEELLSANQLVVKWKKAFEGKAKASQVIVAQEPEDGTIKFAVDRYKVAFEADFGMIGVNGYTLTNPAEAWVSVKQLRPLKITLAVSQDKNKQWHSYATTSEENTAVDISLASVNPYVLEPKWYEKLQLDLTLAGGNTNSGFGVLAGAGVSYKIKQFNVGPAVFIGVNSTPSYYFGANFSWRPFER